MSEFDRFVEQNRTDKAPPTLRAIRMASIPHWAWLIVGLVVWALLLHFLPVESGAWLILLWVPWPILAGWAQHRRGGNVGMGAALGLLFGPLGLLVANYAGGKRCPECRSHVDPKATRCAKCRATLGVPA